MLVTAYIALGSNLGDRQETLRQALEALKNRPGITVIRVSSFHETDPVGGPPGQGPYLNAAGELATDLVPAELLAVLQDVETHFGRVRREKNAPRTLDLDLLLLGNEVRQEPHLTVPHPRMHERFFVLQPLVEIAPHAIHPLLALTVQEMLHKLRTESAGRTEAVPVRGAESSLSPALLRWKRERELAGRRALVTGSTSGIGRAIALELAAAGADVVIHGRRSLEAAERIVDQARALGVRSQALLADLRRADECRGLVEQTWHMNRGLDIWINNAGADTLTGEALHWPLERKLEELQAVDMTATIVLSREVGRRMKEQGGGSIVNMGWDKADIGMEGDSGQLFAAVKAAVMAFSKSLALTLAPEVRVNCVAPGWIKTAWGESASHRWQERVLAETPLGRWGTPEDVAQAVRWLASPAARFVTGQVIRINGGVVR
jgi:2-amino-4-hydroxy-6-hydroxymethyldihydropteridine diphosphokinase